MSDSRNKTDLVNEDCFAPSFFSALSSFPKKRVVVEKNALAEKLREGEGRITEISSDVRLIKNALAQYNEDARASLRETQLSAPKQKSLFFHESEKPSLPQASVLAEKLTEQLGTYPQPDQYYTTDIIKCEGYLYALEEHHHGVLEMANALLPELATNLNQLAVNHQNLIARLG
jgi:hypothetical protein